MSVLNKLAEFVGKYLTYIVFAVVVAAFFFPQGFTWAASQTVLLLSVMYCFFPLLCSAWA